jgi:hypothetical protein
MESVDAKMIRAYETIELLGQEINNWFSNIKFTIITMTAPDRPCPWLVVTPSDYIPPPRLSVLVGECVHNMRSAVDNLVCGLARTLTASCKCRDLAFPLYRDESEWNEKSDRPLRGIPLTAKGVIKTLQPWSDRGTPTPLVILNKLSNIDKHRALNFTLPHNINATFIVHCNNGMVVDVQANKPLYLGDSQTFDLPIDKRLIEPSARIQSSGTLVLTFQEESDWDDIPVIQILRTCFDHIETKVIPKLKPFFEPKEITSGPTTTSQTAS